MKRIISLMLLLTMLLTACTQNQPVENPKDDQINNTQEVENKDNLEENITLIDHDNKEVTIPKKLDRIVVADLNPMPALLSLFLGDSSSIVGMNDISLDAAKNGIIGELFPNLLKVDTSFFKGSELNVEQLLKLEPQLVLITAGNAKLRESIENAGIPVVAFSVGNWNYDIIETYENWIKLLCDIFPANDNLIDVTEYSKDVMNLVQERVSTLDKDEIKDIFFLFQYDEKRIVTSGNNFFGQYWSQSVGANNVAGEIDGGNSPVTMEQIYSWQPDTIFITNFTKAQPEDLYENTFGDNDWSLVEAVRNKEVYKMPLGSFRSYSVSADMPITLLWMAQRTYPKLFDDIDMTKEVMEFYKTVYNVDITEQQANTMFNIGV